MFDKSTLSINEWSPEGWAVFENSFSADLNSFSILSYSSDKFTTSVVIFLSDLSAFTANLPKG